MHSLHPQPDPQVVEAARASPVPAAAEPLRDELQAQALRAAAANGFGGDTCDFAAPRDRRLGRSRTLPVAAATGKSAEHPRLLPASTARR